MRNDTKIALIDQILADAIEFGSPNKTYYEGIMCAISTVVGFEAKELHHLIGSEAEAYRNFRHKHYESCNNGTDFEISLKGSGIGEGITIKCPVCGESEDITDISKW